MMQSTNDLFILSILKSMPSYVMEVVVDEVITLFHFKVKIGKVIDILQ